MNIALIGIDVAAIAVLVFGIYLPRHKRRDLAFALIGVNLGVHVVSTALLTASAATSLGFGLGLFGVLSIIRLRSSQISQREVAYYIASLAIALITGGATTIATSALLTVVILIGIAVSEYLPALRATQSVEVRFDRAMSSEAELRAASERLIHGKVETVTIIRIDEVDDLTVAQVTYTDHATARSRSRLTPVDSHLELIAAH